MTAAPGFMPAAPARRPVGPVVEHILRRLWSAKLKRSGFRDLENPENPDGLLSTAGSPSHLRRQRQRHAINRLGFNGELGMSTEPEYVDRTGARRNRTYRDSTAVAVELTAHYYRRMEHLAARFDDETDRAIAEALSDGAGQRRIKADLHVSQRRIERVEAQIRIWMREPTPTSEDDE